MLHLFIEVKGGVVTDTRLEDNNNSPVEYDLVIEDVDNGDPEPYVGQLCHIDVDDQQWGRVAFDGRVLEVNTHTKKGKPRALPWCLIWVNSIRANIAVHPREVHSRN